MPFEFTILVWGCLLGAVHIFLAVRTKIKLYGSKWSMGARDETLPPPSPGLARLMRAQSNFFETFPIVVAGVALLGLTDLGSRWTALGALIWFVARLIYLPLYGFGVPVARTLTFMISVAGIITLFWPLLLTLPDMAALVR